VARSAGLARDRSKWSAMISSEVQRTLVKSPPELWAEISDPESLARHLGEFGEIRITRVQPEQKVEWEADDASGSIVIKPSGWGTKVRLTVERELSAPDADADPRSADESRESGESGDAGEASAPSEVEAPATVREPAAEDEPEGEAELEPEADFEPEAAFEPEAQLGSEAEFEPEDPALAVLPGEPSPPPAAEEEGAPERPRRHGFFARLFSRRRAARSVEIEGAVEAARTVPQHEYENEHEDEHEYEDGDEQHDAEAFAGAAEPVDDHEDVAHPAPAAGASDAPAEPAAPSDAQPDSRPAAAVELERAEEAAEAQVTAVLTSVLDRLGAAHHRPFSRA
jgi:hypothetical protein